MGTLRFRKDPSFLTKSCHPNISSDVASDGIKHLVGIEIVIPNKLNLKTNQTIQEKTKIELMKSEF